MIEFAVWGTPVPQGSKRVFGGNVVEVADARLRSWRQDVAAQASAAMHGHSPFSEPVEIRLTFHFSRPKGHFGTGRNQDRLKPSAPIAPGVKPDLDKLVRSVLDALTGVVFRDDAQVVWLTARKCYALMPGLGGLEAVVNPL